MPDGLLQWFDATSGEAAIVRGNHVFRARAADVESVARHAGARVHFDVQRDQGVDRAVKVTLRRGTRVSHHQTRFGTLVGARRPDTKGTAPFSSPHPELGRAPASHPVEIASTWATLMGDADLDRALSLYAPDAVIHAGEHAFAGPHLRRYLEASALLGNRRRSETRGVDGDVEVTWPGRPEEGGGTVRCHLEHGQIAEQWIGEAAPEPASIVVEGAAGSLEVHVLTRGDVPGGAIEYAAGKVAAVSHRIDEPILFARVKLTQAADPARTRPAMAQVAIDVNGDLVRAGVASHTMREAVDLLEGRLRDKLEHRAQRREAERRLVAIPEPGEWRHGDLPTTRPTYFERPVDERELVRHKTFVTDELTPDEAAFDMDQLDYDFYLFRDLASGTDSLIQRQPDGTYRMTHGQRPAVEPGPTALRLQVAELPAPESTVPQAIERLDTGGEPFVFFVNAATGRGNVVYRRYDGHYGLLTPD